MRHDFVIEALARPAWFRARDYIYHCSRCGWTFRVNGVRTVIALDESRRPLGAAENRRRIDTFAEGPCPQLALLLAHNGHNGNSAKTSSPADAERISAARSRSRPRSPRLRF